MHLDYSGGAASWNTRAVSLERIPGDLRELPQRNMVRFDGKVVVITGAGRGLGRADALLFAHRGAHVVINDSGVGPDGLLQDACPAQVVAEEIRSAGGSAVADFHSVVDAADQIVATALREFGRLDVLINNAGIVGGGPFNEIPSSEFDALLDVHLSGTISMARASWKHLAASGCGRIINISSQAMFGAPYASAYSTAKSALYGLTRSLAGEGRALGIHVNAVMPSAWTRLTALIPDKGLRQLLKVQFPPAAVAPFIAWLAHAETRVSGETFSVGGGRAGRVVLAEAPGAHVVENTPEAWAGQAASVMSLDELSTPLSMLEELALQTAALGLPFDPTGV